MNNEQNIINTKVKKLIDNIEEMKADIDLYAMIIEKKILLAV